MTKATRKNLHAVAIALVSVLTDVSLQLGSPSFSPTRAVIVGLVVGAVARLFGAYLASTEATPTE